MTSTKMWLSVLCLFALTIATINGRPSEDVDRLKRSLEQEQSDNTQVPLSQGQQPVVLVDPTELEYLAYLRNMILTRGRAMNGQTSEYGQVEATPPNQLIRKRAGNLCLPGTDCDSINWGDEADAKDLLQPGADTNPGRRRRSVDMDTVKPNRMKRMVDSATGLNFEAINDDDNSDKFVNEYQALIDLKSSKPLVQSLFNSATPDMVDTFLTKCLDDTSCKEELLARRLESIKNSSENKFFNRIH